MNIHDDGVLKAKWRVGVGVGNAVGRGIFAQLGEYPNGQDTFLGIMDEARDAQHIVEVHNASLDNGPLSPAQQSMLDQLTGKDPDGLRKVVVDFLTVTTKLPGLADAPDTRLIAELRKQIPPPPRCLAEEGATGIQCYRNDEHEVHEGFWEQAKVHLRWPAPDPRTSS